MDVKISYADKEDEKQLIDWFRHYNLKELAERRVSCYLSKSPCVLFGTFGCSRCYHTLKCVVCVKHLDIT